MQFINITQDTRTTYTLKHNERVCFFMLNRVGTLTFRLPHSNAEAIILALTLHNTGVHALSVIQEHIGHHTVSRFIARNIISGEACFSYDGRIDIAPSAIGADATQECRSLILSNQATVNVRPALEIKTDAVRCSHAATTSTLNENTLFYLLTRGLDAKTSRALAISGFAYSLFTPYQTILSNKISLLQHQMDQILKKVI